MSAVRATVHTNGFDGFTVQVEPQLTVVAGDEGAAVRVIVVPLVKVAMQVEGQLIPAGELVTVPGPEAITSSSGPDPPPVPVKHTTFAVMVPLTMAPEEDRSPAL